MQKFYTSVNLQINTLKEIGGEQFSFFGSRGDQNCLLMHIPLKVDMYSKIVSEYDQEIPQSQTTDNPMAPQERAT